MSSSIGRIMMRGGVIGGAVLCLWLAGGGGGVQAFVSLPFSPVASGRTTNTAAPLGFLGRSSTTFAKREFSAGGGVLKRDASRSPSSGASTTLNLARGGDASKTTRMTAADNNKSTQAAQGPMNAGALSLGVACAVGASAISEISPHAAAFVQLVCLSIWLGMSVYTTFVWPVITGINMRDSSEFAALLGKLAPSYLQLSAAMIMSLGTSSVVIGHANGVQLFILGVALGITLYNILFLEPTALDALEEEQEMERRLTGTKDDVADENLPKMQAQLANFLGAEVLLDLLAILCAGAYAWDLASSITIA